MSTFESWQNELEAHRRVIARWRERKDRELEEDSSLERVLENNQHWSEVCVTVLDEMGNIALRECQPISKPERAVAHFKVSVSRTRVEFDKMVRDTRTKDFALVVNIGWARMCVEVVDQFGKMIERRKAEAEVNG